MAKALKTGGKLYLSFPCAESINFNGNRSGCLNYYDDFTHKSTPPDFGETVSQLHQLDIKIIYANTRYMPPLDWFYGLSNEKQSAESKIVLNGTWALYGFETIIWGEKL